MLELEKKEAFFVKERTINEEIEKAYDVSDFDISCTEEMSNDSYFVADVEPKPLEWVFLERWEDRYVTNNILNDMCHRGLIPAGTYVIEISW